MVKGIHKRLLSYYLLVVAIIVIIMGLFFVWFLNYFYMRSLENNLYIQGRLAAALFDNILQDGALPNEIDKFCKTLGSELEVRITVIDREGTVLADSARDPVSMDNHGDRPEIIAALEHGKGTAERYSDTLDQMMYYMAVPLTSTEAEVDEPPAGFVRLALPLTDIQQATFQLRLFVGGVLFISALAATGLAALLSRKITGQISKISSAAGAIARGNYTPTLEMPGDDELSMLASDIQKMGRELDTKINQVLKEKSKLETVVTSMSTGIIFLDQDLQVEIVNPAAEKLFDLNKEQVSGEQFQTVIRHHVLFENLKTVVIKKEPQQVELSLYFPREKVLETLMMPILDKEKTLIGILLIFHEVTHLRSLEKMRSDFVANVSHELRTPLTTIQGYTETIMHMKLNQEQLEEFLLIIERETRRISSLVEDLLDLSRIENEKGHIQKDSIDLGELIKEAVESVEEIKSHKEAAIKMRFASPKVLVQGNADWLRQAIINILENSIRHGQTGVQIIVMLNTDDEKVVVEIKDNGPGIPEADLPYVFERFYRVDKARSRKSGGTGLGLAIVKHIMEAHGASYNLTSSEETGTIFIFTLPLRD